MAPNSQSMFFFSLLCTNTLVEMQVVCASLPAGNWNCFVSWSSWEPKTEKKKTKKKKNNNSWDLRCLMFCLRRLFGIVWCEKSEQGLVCVLIKSFTLEGAVGEYVLLFLLLTCVFILKTQDSPGKIKDIIHSVASEQLPEEELYMIVFFPRQVFFFSNLS